MANRSHVYTYSTDPLTHKDLSEWKWAIPVAHQLLASGNPRVAESHIWNNDQKIAIEADFAAGIERLSAFLGWLQRQPEVANPAALAKAIQRTQAFFEKSENRKPFVLLEAAEIFVLDETTPLGTQAEQLVAEIRMLAAEVDRAIANEGQVPRTLLKLVETWEEELGLYWIDVVYFSLNGAAETA